MMQNLLSSKKLRIGLMAALMVAGSFAVAHSVYAQATPVAPTESSSTAAVSTSAATAGPSNTQGNSPTASMPGCSIENLGHIGDCILNSIAYFMLGFANFILGIAGILLNWVIVKTVFQFASLIGNSQGLLTAWGILRDIGNLLLLFGFVLMGIGTILNTSKLPDKKAIPKLIIFAVLLNFSLFATEAVIDVSNVLTSVMYSQANTSPCLNTSDANCDINHGIAGHIMEATGLSGIYAVQGTDLSSYANKVWVIMGLAIFAMIGTVVLFAAAIMLAWRAITLTGLIILSPLGFAGMALPPLAKITGKWWNTLIHQAFFAPILFLLIFVSLKVTEGFSASSNNNSLAVALLQPGASTTGIIMVFLLMSGALIASLIAAKSFGAMGANMAIKTAGSFAFGSGAFIGRRTVGAASAAASRSIRSSSFGTTIVGKTLAGVADRGAKSSFDLRATTGKGGLAIGKTKLDIGKPNATAAKGIVEIEKKATEARTAYAKTLTQSPAAKKIDEQLGKDKKTQAANEKAELQSQKDKEAAAKSKWGAREKDLDGKINELNNKIAEQPARRAALEKQIADQEQASATALRTGNTSEAMKSNTTVTTLRKQLDEIELETSSLQAYAALKEKEGKAREAEIEKLKAEREAVVKKYEGVQEGLTKQLADNNLQMQYAERMSSSPLNKVWPVSNRANTEAANKIKADFKKSKADKNVDKLQGAIEKAAKGDQEAMATVAEAVKEIGDEDGDGEKDT